jgi:hypothetical protein
MVYQSVLAFAFLATQASAACSRATLQSAVASYLQAQAAGKPSLLIQAANLTYAENDVPSNISKGVLSQAITIDFSRSIFDTTSCSTFTEITAATDRHPYVIDTRMLVSGESATDIQSVVADTGDWVFNATSQLRWTKTETWDPIPEGQRDSRATIKAAGDAYLDSWKDGNVKAPYGSFPSSSSPSSLLTHIQAHPAPASKAAPTPVSATPHLTAASCPFSLHPLSTPGAPRTAVMWLMRNWAL